MAEPKDISTILEMIKQMFEKMMGTPFSTSTPAGTSSLTPSTTSTPVVTATMGVTSEELKSESDKPSSLPRSTKLCLFNYVFTLVTDLKVELDERNMDNQNPFSPKMLCSLSNFCPRSEIQLTESPLILRGTVKALTIASSNERYCQLSRPNAEGKFSKHDKASIAPALEEKAPKFYPPEDIKEPLSDERKPKPTNSNQGLFPRHF
ncbi:hypothetical protein C2S53_015421 [Perilla frutescens var. hirtella]|uniref:Uncharacterized protein n=1 Tax=Perilla frutescens var. hirtella TaxID=608512 RepID=A0AAD4IXB4_PERFH|nr:hypothetical protein C2S53_015421 [Perilla frutescens var. hirtella]